MCGPEKQVIKKEALVKLLRWHFGYSDFRGKQLEAIQAVLSGPFYFAYFKDHNYIYVVMDLFWGLWWLALLLLVGYMNFMPSSLW